ncbi:MAG: response regulator transcription factor [Bacteroidales bacterium]|nr:response regulator transcription factor [Bacteroidales bacterium]
MIRVLAIDDEPLALKQLESYISKVPYLELAGSCLSAIEARALLEDSVVDAMFLDINMPDLSGMDFVRSLDNPPLVVFTTAYSEYAIDGFKVEAVDYLLKPFSLADFMAAAERVKNRLELLKDKSAPVFEHAPSEDAIFFRTDYKTVRVRLDDIRYVESMSEYIKVYVNTQPAPLIVLLSLKYLMEKLPSDRFMRVHRSYIIPLRRIREVGKGELVLDGGDKIPVGDLYRQDLKDYLAGRSVG